MSGDTPLASAMPAARACAGARVAAPTVTSQFLGRTHVPHRALEKAKSARLDAFPELSPVARI